MVYSDPTPNLCRGVALIVRVYGNRLLRTKGKFSKIVREIKEFVRVH